MPRSPFIIIALIFLVGCVSQAEIEESMSNIYNVPSSGTSQFDESKYIRISNMVCSNTVVFELYQDTPKVKRGIVLLKAGSRSIDNIDNGKSLHIKTDNNKYSFASKDALTEHDKTHYGYGVTTYFSHKTYLVSESVIREIASSNKFLVKMNLLNDTYIEGKCTPLSLQETQEQSVALNVEIKQEHVDTASKFAAINGFRTFVRMMDSTAW